MFAFQEITVDTYFGKMLDTCNKFLGGGQESNVLSSVFCIIENLHVTNSFLFILILRLGAVSRPWLRLGSVFSPCMPWKTCG